MQLKASAGARLRDLRAASPGLDHLVKAFGRYFADSSDRLAASVTYYGFLCIFPMLLLLGSVVGYVVRGDASREQELLEELVSYVPETLAVSLVDLVTDRAGTTGLLGLIGLIIAGLGWIDALRESIRAIWHQHPYRGNVLLKKVKDLGILVGLGLTVLLSVVVTGFATSLTQQGVDLLGVSATSGVRLLQVVALLLGLLSDVAVLVYLLLWLPHAAEPVRRVLRGAVVGAIGLGVAKWLGFYYFGLVLGEGASAYGASLATAVGLLLWINVMARVIMFTAAWTVTAPYNSDVRPSGTARRPAQQESDRTDDDDASPPVGPVAAGLREPI